MISIFKFCSQVDGLITGGRGGEAHKRQFTVARLNTFLFQEAFEFTFFMFLITLFSRVYLV